jgi:coenzyme Q-binding protein COQ10
MVIKTTGRTVPFSCEQLFDVAAAIERYPEFLPGWRSARILRRVGNTCYVQQELALGLLHVQFESQAVLLRPSRIEISSTDRRFRTCRCSLRVLAAGPAGPAGSRLSIEADLELSSELLQTILNQFQSVSLESIVAAFEARAHGLYGGVHTHEITDGSVRQRTEPPAKDR